MRQALLSIAETQAAIARGGHLLLAGDERALAQLPRGSWIGGTIPYFMAEAGGVVARDQVFVTELPDSVERVAITTYDPEGLHQLVVDGPDNGFTAVILPAGSAVHTRFALEAPHFPGFGSHPVVGWVSGVHLSELATAKAKVVSGLDPVAFDDRAVAMHVHMRPGKAVEIEIVNPFEQGQGDALGFPDNTMRVSDALINGERRNFAAYIAERGLDTRLPLVADYCGTGINVSIQQVDHDRGEVVLYAPVFAGVTYRHARPIASYVAEFARQMPAIDEGIVFSCNCILNFLYSELEGKRTGGLVGPITFGEIAYQLLNQTAVYLRAVDTV